MSGGMREILEEFFVRCPSDVHEEEMSHLHTGPSHFRFNVVPRLVLENTHQWYVALHEIFTPRHFYNIYNPFNYDIMAWYQIDVDKRKKEVAELEDTLSRIQEMEKGVSNMSEKSIKRELDILKKSEPFKQGSDHRIHIPSAHYTCDAFVKKINEVILYNGQQHEIHANSDAEEDNVPVAASESNVPYFTYHKPSAKFRLTLYPGDVVSFGHKRFRNLIGYFGDTTVKEYVIKPHQKKLVLRNIVPDMIKHTHIDSTMPCTVYFPTTCDLDAENRHLYVYADVIKHTRVGNRYVPLLRIVNMSSNGGDISGDEVVNKEFYHPQYFPVSERIINTIEIQMHTSAGDIFPFKHGTSILDLHFVRFK